MWCSGLVLPAGSISKTCSSGPLVPVEIDHRPVAALAGPVLQLEREEALDVEASVELGPFVPLPHLVGVDALESLQCRRVVALHDNLFVRHLAPPSLCFRRAAGPLCAAAPPTVPPLNARVNAGSTPVRGGELKRGAVPPVVPANAGIQVSALRPPTSAGCAPLPRLRGRVREGGRAPPVSSPHLSGRLRVGSTRFSGSLRVEKVSESRCHLGVDRGRFHGRGLLPGFQNFFMTEAFVFHAPPDPLLVSPAEGERT